MTRRQRREHGGVHHDLADAVAYYRDETIDVLAPLHAKRAPARLQQEVRGRTFD